MSSKEVALITGANKGIGLAAARQLGEQGYTVWLGCRDAARGESAVSELRNTGVDAQLLVLDVADTQSVAAAKGKFQEQAGTLDVLINNAGISLGGVPVRVTEETVDDMRDVRGEYAWTDACHAGVFATAAAFKSCAHRDGKQHAWIHFRHHGHGKPDMERRLWWIFGDQECAQHAYREVGERVVARRHQSERGESRVHRHRSQ